MYTKANIVNPKTGKRIPLEIPTDWEELTLLQFCQLQTALAKKEANPNPRYAGDLLYQAIGVSSVEWLELLTGIGKDIWNQCEKKTVGPISLLSTIILEEEAPNWENLPFDPVLEIPGYQPAIIPRDSEQLPWVVYNNAEMERTRANDAMYIPRFLSHILYTAATGEDYDDMKVQPFADVLAAMPAVKLMPIAYFFFLRWKKLQLSGRKGLAKRKQQQKRSKRGQKGWKTLVS